MLVGLAVPYLSGRILNPGSFTAVPRYWYQVAGVLAAHSPRQRGARGARGRARRVPVGGSDRRPAGGAGNLAVGGAGAGALRRHGITARAPDGGERHRVRRAGARPGRLPAAGRHPLRRRPERPGPGPGRLHPTRGGAPDTRHCPGSPGSPRSEPPRSTWCPASRPGSRCSPVSALPVSQTVLVNGGPDSLLQLAGQRLLGPGQPTVVAGNPLPSLCPRLAGPVGGHRRAAAGRRGVRPDQLNISYTYTATETIRWTTSSAGRAGRPASSCRYPQPGTRRWPSCPAPRR